MRLNYIVAKPFLLGILLLLGACHDDDKSGPEHKGEGQLVVTVKNPAGQPLTLRVFGEGLKEPFESRLEATEKEGTFDAWLAEGEYDALVTADAPGEVVIDGTGSFATATASVPVPEGSETIPALNEPVYTAASSGIVLTEGKTNELTLNPKDIRKIVRFTVTVPDGMVSGPIAATLRGIASAVSLASGEVAASATLRLTLPAPDAQNTSRTTAGILGVVRTENVIPGVDDDSHLLALTWKAADGKEQSYSEDVSSQLYKALEADADTIDVAVTVAARAGVPIHLYTAIRTRSLVDEFNATPVNIAAGTASGKYAESWEGIASANEIVLNPERYYPADGSPVYLRGYYPVAPLENGEVHYTLTGKEDLMLSVEQNGSLTDRFTAVSTPLTYRHLLAQLNFKLTLKGVTDQYRIRSVKLNGMAERARVSLISGTVEPIGQSAPIVIYADPGTGGFPITDGSVMLPGYVLVQPEAELTLDLVLNVDGNPANDKVFKNLPVNFTEGGTEGGSAYEVEISFEVPDDPAPDPTPDPDPAPDPNPDPDPSPDPGPSPKPDPDPEPEPEPVPDNGIKVEVTAKVTDWNTGDNGGVIV